MDEELMMLAADRSDGIGKSKSDQWK